MAGSSITLGALIIVSVVIYIKPTCPFCVRALQLLESKGIQSEIIDITNAPALRSEMIEKSGGHTVPQIFINETLVGGCDDLFQLETSGQLEQLLTK